MEEENFSEKELITDESMQLDKEVGKKDTKEDTKKLLILIAVVVGFFLIVFFSVKFVSFSSDEVMTLDDLHMLNIEGEESDINYMYGGYSFVKYDGLWYTQLQNEEEIVFDVPLHYGPRELEDFYVSGDITQAFLDNPLYISFDPLGENLQYVTLSVAELSLNLVGGLALIPTAACMKNETDACATRLILSTCQDDKAIIFVREDEEPGVVMMGNCVVLKGQGEELVKATDRFLLRLYNIMM